MVKPFATKTETGEAFNLNGFIIQMTSYTFETKMCSNRWYKEATCYEWQLGFK